MADRTVLVRLAASTAPYRSEIDKASRSTKAFVDGAVDGTGRAARGLKQVQGEATALGAVMVAAPIAGAVAFMGFDKMISKVGAVTGASASQMDALRTAAIDAGQATVFSASEAAAAEAELAKAGVTTSDILGGALTGSLNLAAAGELDVAEAASIAATTMTQFGLKGNDVGHIADLLASAANKAQGEVTDMAAALKYVGPVASQMGVPLEQTVGTIAELASQGILGEQAGTSLRGMLSSLTSPSSIAAKTMNGLGIEVYDATGKFVGFDGVAQQMRDTMGGLTNAERDEAFGRIFGNEQITAARILYAGGAADVDKWTQAVDDAGAAERLASQYLDNLAGDVEQLTGSIETGLIQAGSGANDVLRWMTQRATDAVNAISQMPPGFLAVAGGASFMAGSFLLLAPRIVDTVDALKQMKATSGVGGIGKGLGFTAAIAAVGYLVMETMSANGELRDMLEAADEIDRAFASGVMPKDTKLSDLAKQAEEVAAKLRQAATDPSWSQKVAQGWNALWADFFDEVDGDPFAQMTQQFSDAADQAQAPAIEYGKALDYVSSQMGVNRDEAASLMDQAQAAGVVISGSYETQGRAVTTWAATTTQGHGAAQIAMAKTADVAGAMVDAVLGAMNQLDQRGKERAFQQSIDAATEALKKNKRTLDIHTEAGRANADALDDIAAKTLDLATSKDKEGNVTITNTKALNAGALAYARTAMQMGLSKSEAIKLTEKVVGVKLELDKLGRMRVVPKVIVDTTTGMTRAQALKTLLDQIKSKTVNIDVYQQVHGSAVVNPDRAERRVGRAGGGPITGPGTATSDSIPIMASDGEWMIKAAAVDRLEARFGPGVMHQINTGHLPGYASGGKVTKREARRNAAIAKVTDLRSAKASSIESIASSMSSAFGLMNAFDFGAQARAIDELASAQERLTAANEGVADSDREVFDARRAVNSAGSPKERADAESRLAEALKRQAKARAEQASAEGDVTVARAAVTKAAPTRENILAGWTTKLKALKAFKDNLVKLRKRGFSAHMVATIAADPDGAELAQALADASPDQVKRFNSIDAQTQQLSGSIGRIAAGAQYDPQIRDAQQAAMGLGATAKQVGPLVPAFGTAKVVIHSHMHVGRRQIAESKVDLSRRDGGYDWGDG